MEPGRESTVRSLQELYTVTVGAALFLAIEQIARTPNPCPSETDKPHNWVSMLPGFVAFLATLIPFYHGALRHLDLRYVEERGLRVRSGALLADFLLLFIEACLILAAACQLPNLESLTWCLVALLAVDAVWGSCVYWFFTRERHNWAELGWARLNIITVAVITSVQAVPKLLHREFPPEFFGVALPAIALTRTIVDYSRAWRFYFPDDAPRG